MEHMQRAVQLAGGALGATSPNPAVGAVLVRDGREIGRILGYGGEEHFWGLLGPLLQRLESAAPKGG